MVDESILLKILENSESKFNILTILEKEPCYVRELSDKMKIFPSAVIKHLRFLEYSNIVSSEEIENKKYYKITKLGKKILNRLKKTN